jgi:hypothetical protein
MMTQGNSKFAQKIADHEIFIRRDAIEPPEKVHWRWRHG